MTDLEDTISEAYSRSRILSKPISGKELSAELRSVNRDTAMDLQSAILHSLTTFHPPPNSFYLYDFYRHRDIRERCKILLRKFSYVRANETATRISTAQSLSRILHTFVLDPWVLKYGVNHELIDILPIGPMMDGDVLQSVFFDNALYTIHKFMVYLEALAELIEATNCCLVHAKTTLQQCGRHLEVDFYLPVFFLGVVSNVTCS